MTISYGSLGTIVYDNATSPLTVSYPTTVTAGDKILLFVGQKPSSANSGTVTTPSGFTLIGSALAQGGYGTTLGIDTGNTNIYVYEKDAAGTEGGTTISLAHATTNVLWARMIRFSSSIGSGWDTTTFTTGSDSTAGSVSIAGAADPGFTAGDFAVWGMCIPTDVTTPSQFSAHAITASGVTFATATELFEADSATGNDIGGYVAYTSVSSGTSTGAPTFTATAGGTTTNVRGPGIIVRLREGVAPVFASYTNSTSSTQTYAILNDSPNYGNEWVTPTEVTTGAQGANWSGTSNLTASDDTRATCTMGSAESADYLIINFGLNIASDANITGMSFEVEGSSSNTPLVHFVAISSDGGANGINGSYGPNIGFGTSESVITLGGVSNDWNVTLTPALLNDADFRFVLAFVGAVGSGTTVNIDQVRVKVHTNVGGQTSSALFWAFP